MNPVKRYLLMVKKSDEDIMRLSFRLKALEEAKENGFLRSPELKERVQTSLSGDAEFESAVQELADMQARYVKNVVRCEKRKDVIENQIMNVKSTTYQQILFLRYFEGKRMGEIADILGYTPETIQIYHGKALIAFAMANPRENWVKY